MDWRQQGHTYTKVVTQNPVPCLKLGHCKEEAEKRSESLDGRIIRPPLFINPPPLKGYFQGSGVGGVSNLALLFGHAPPVARRVGLRTLILKFPNAVRSF